MKKHEFESLTKSFFLFFLSLGLLLALLIYLDYKKQVDNLKQDIFAQMRLCSFDLKCKKFYIDFKEKNGIKPLFLYEDSNGLTSYFTFLGSKRNLLSINYPLQEYKKDILKITKQYIIKFFIYLSIITILSILFSIYSLYPMRKALNTIEEFIKDILHDVNTPITTIVLNSSLLKQDEKNRDKIKKIQHSTKKILSIQENLKSYLLELSTQKEIFDLKNLLIEQQKYILSIYPNLECKVIGDSIKLKTNEELFKRVISNIVSNAAKYNKTNGQIIMKIEPHKKRVIISDTGIGIKDTKKIFQRFYKEGERGTGIGLHIVKKICNELNIGIKVTSTINKGSSFTLYLDKLTIS